MSGVVSNGSIATMWITLFISLFLPILALILYAVKHKKQGVVKAWFLGAAGFYVMQLVIRTSILTVLSMTEEFAVFVENHYLIYALLLGVTAALFEVVGRYVCARMLRKDLTYTKAFAAGLGHGGIEAMFLIGVAYINNLIYASAINDGSIAVIIEQAKAAGADVSQIYAMADTLVNTPSYLYLLAGYERILTMTAHIAMTLVVFYFMWKNQTIKGIVICVIYHTLLDGAVGVISGLATPYLGSVISQNVSYVIIYVYLTVMAAVAVFAIHKVKTAWSAEAEV